MERRRQQRGANREGESLKHRVINHVRMEEDDEELVVLKKTLSRAHRRRRRRHADRDASLRNQYEDSRIARVIAATHHRASFVKLSPRPT